MDQCRAAAAPVEDGEGDADPISELSCGFSQQSTSKLTRLNCVSFFVATNGDIAAADTGGADPQMKHILEQLKHIRSSRKLLVGKLRKEEENNRRKSRRIAHFERQEKESKVCHPLSLLDVKWG